MKNLIYLLPFTGIGISISGFIVGPTFLYVFIFIVLGVYKRATVNRRLFTLYSMVIFVFTISVISRYSLNSYFLSLIAYAYISFLPILCVRSNNDDSLLLYQAVSNVVNYLLLICTIEFIVNFMAPNYWLELQKFVYLNGSANRYFGITRLRAFTTEPSMLAQILCLYYLLTLCLEKYFNYKSLNFIKLKIFLMLILTMSTTGIFIIAGLQLLSTMMKLGSIIINLKIRINYKDIFKIFIFFVIVYYTGNYFDSFTYKMGERLFAIREVLMTGHLSGSVGFRVGSLLVIPLYISEANMFNLLLGEGFSNFSIWLSNRYSHLPYSGLSEGLPGNLITALILSSGILGTICFFIYIFFICHSASLYMTSLSLFFCLGLLLSSGQFASVIIWSCFAIIARISNLIKTETRLSNLSEKIPDVDHIGNKH